MNSEWKAFLEARSAVIDERGELRFPDAPAAADCALCALPQLGLIAVSGPDAEGFLQGQLTNDVRELSDTHTQLSSHCSPKGRMLAAFRVLRIDDTFYLQLPRTELDGMLKRLRMFVLRSRVSVADADEELVAIGLAGDCAPRLLADHLAVLPERDNDMSTAGPLTAIRIPGTTPRFEVLGPATELGALWDALAAEADLIDPGYWSLLDIRAGIPSVHAQTADTFVPQMTNMQLIDGVSFTKGCYTGQEVVARMQYLGKLKRRMYLAEVTAEAPPEPGDELHSASSTSEQASGRVVDARPAGDGRYELLAVVEIAAADAGDVHLGPNGPRLTLREPPYRFPAES
jgi:folate-binding protein YgfZ